MLALLLTPRSSCWSSRLFHDPIWGDAEEERQRSFPLKLPLWWLVQYFIRVQRTPHIFMFCGVFPPHGANSFISSNIIKHEPSKLLYFFLHLSCQKQPLCLLNIKLNSPSCGTSDSVPSWETLNFFQSIKELAWRAKGWVVEQGCSLSTNQSPSASWTGLLMSNPVSVTLLKSSLAIVSMESSSLWSSVSSHGSHQREAAQKQNISLSVKTRKGMSCSGNVTWRLQIYPIYLGR